MRLTFLGTRGEPDRPLYRRRRDRHAVDGAEKGGWSAMQQLDWCAKAHVRWVVFTHCGSPIVRASARAAESLVSGLGGEHGIKA
jgi:hypothetical protein